MGKKTVIDGKKTCLKCGLTKDVSEFEFRESHNGKKYYRSPCKKCANERKRGYSKKYRLLYRHEINKKANERIKERKKAGDVKLTKSLKNARLKHLYGITLEEYEKQKETQKNRCYICNTKEQKKALSVDHNHNTGKVRKLLCWKCNVILGAIEEDETILNKMIQYLKEHE